MTTSGTWNFQLPNTSIVFEAFERIQVNPASPAMDPQKLISARNSLNLVLLEWSNKGFNFWKLTSGTVNLAVNQATYVLPATLVVLTEIWYSLVNAGGPGINQDRILVPIDRTSYAQITNKLQPGIPTQYWLQMLSPAPQITIWQVPQAGQVAPAAVLNWYGLQQLEDANVSGLETPDIHYRATEALIAALALKLCEKFGPTEPQARQALMVEKKTLADSAWNDLQRRDQEPGFITYRPNLYVYGRMS